MVNGGSSFADCSPLAFFRLEKLLGLVSSSSSCITHRPLLSHNWTLLGGAAIRFVFSLLHRCANRNGSLIDSPFQACSIPTFQVFILARGIVVLHRAQRITTPGKREEARHVRVEIIVFTLRCWGKQDIG
eukprot:scaffold5681_cov196-Alexandrium_tamarense.AAC.4